MTAPEWLPEARRLLAEGLSYREVARTLEISLTTLTRHLPGQGWTHQQGGEIGNAVRRANQVIRAHGMKQ